jgi:4-hydroxy-tetrahydrodipicolinate synthase
MAPSKTGILVYNAPGIGITLSPALLEQLAEIPNVVGIKQGDLNPTAIDQMPTVCVDVCACSASIWPSRQ